MRSIGVLKNGGLKAAYAIRATSARHRPVFMSATGQAAHFMFLAPQRERAERMARSRFRGPPAGQASSPHAVREIQRHTSGGPARGVRAFRLSRGLGRSFSPAFRTRMDLSACWMSQGWSIPPTFPRSCVLTPGHALEPSAPSAVVRPRPSPGQATLKTSAARQSLRTSAPRSTQHDHRCALRIGTGQR